MKKLVSVITVGVLSALTLIGCGFGSNSKSYVESLSQK